MFGLQRLNVGAEKFKVIVDHARRCEIGGKLYVYHTSGHERKFPVVFDVVGHLRGLVREQLFVPVHDLAEDEKVLLIFPYFPSFSSFCGI